MWSFGEWIQKKSWIFQIQFDMMIRTLPFFTGYFMIAYYWNATRPPMPQDWLHAMGIISQIVAPGALVWALGTLMIESYRNKVKSDAQKNKSINMCIWWTDTQAWDEDNFITDYGILKEQIIKQFILKHKLDNPDIKDDKVRVREFAIKYGYYYYEIVLKREMEDNKGLRWRHAILLSAFPWENFMRDVPDQFVSNNGIIFTTPAAKLNLIYCNEFTEIGKEEGSGFENYKVFKVGFDPEKVYLQQKLLGLNPENTTKEAVEEAAQLSISRTATQYAIGKRESDGQLRAYIETHQDSRIRSIAESGKFLENSDFIRKSRDRFAPLKNRSNLIKIAIVAGLLLLIAYNQGWLRFGKLA